MIDKNKRISQGFYWFNEPVYSIADDKLIIETSPDTDFWQTTHYGFQRDNGHCLLKDVSDNFSMTVKTDFHPHKQYDQCGLIVRLDSNNWIKASVEYETESHSRLGSVITNQGYSDWATIDVHTKISEMFYRIQSSGNDFIIEYSFDGVQWQQQRIAHLHKSFSKISIGVYACSPMDSTFQSTFSNFSIGKNEWS